MSLTIERNASSECPEVLAYYSSSEQHFIMLIHVIACICGLLCTGLFLKFGQHALYFHKNCTLLIYLICFCHVMECLSMGGSQGFHLILLSLKSYPCDLLVQNALCFAIRTPSVFFNNYMTFLFCAMVFERFLAIHWCKHYEKKDMTIGLILAAAAVFPTVVSYTCSLRNYPLSGNTWYCASAIKETINDISTIATGLSFFTLVPAISLVGLWYFNERKRKSNPYNVTTRYQLAENLSVLSLLAPQVVLFSVFQCSFSIINSFSHSYIRLFDNQQQYKTFLAAVNISVYHPILSTLLFLFVLLRNKHKRKSKISRMKKTPEQQKEAYFNAYQKQWN